MTTYSEALASTGENYYAVDFDAATTQVTMQNTTKAPLTFRWGGCFDGHIREITVNPKQTVYFSTVDAARGGLAMPTGGGITVIGNEGQAFEIDVT